ncbi:MAG: hypothetical protein JWQ21_3787 [Herminiimonas sp.]|nr:hypothetical protein [Herminiimonas sp.]
MHKRFWSSLVEPVEMPAVDLRCDAGLPMMPAPCIEIDEL